MEPGSGQGEAGDAEIVEVDRISLGLPARRYRIRATIGYDARVPLLTEFTLRLLRIAGQMTPSRLVGYFGLSQREADVLLDDLLQNGLVEYERNMVGLSRKGRELFVGSDDRDPRIVAVEEFSANIAFERVTMSPLERLPYDVVSTKSVIKMQIKDRERAAKATSAIRESFRKNFGEIATSYLTRKSESERAYVYSVDEVAPRAYFTHEIVLPVELVISDPPTLRPNYGKLDRGRYGSRDELIRVTAERVGSIFRDSRLDWIESQRFLSEFDQGAISREVAPGSISLQTLRKFQNVAQPSSGESIETSVRFLGSFVTDSVKTLLLQKSEPSRFGPSEDPVLYWVRPCFPHWGRSGDYDDLFSDLHRTRAETTRFTLIANLEDNIPASDIVRWFKDEPHGRRRFSMGAFIRPGIFPPGIELVLSPGRWLAVLAYVPLFGSDPPLPVGLFSEERSIVEAGSRALANRMLPLTTTGGALWPFEPLSLDQTAAMIEEGLRTLIAPGGASQETKLL